MHPKIDCYYYIRICVGLWLVTSKYRGKIITAVLLGAVAVCKCSGGSY